MPGKGECMALIVYHPFHAIAKWNVDLNKILMIYALR
jgi:hypothetical protein